MELFHVTLLEFVCRDQLTLVSLKNFTKKMEDILTSSDLNMIVDGVEVVGVDTAVEK